MSLNIHKVIRDEYDKRRKRAQEELDERKLALYYSIPRLEEIEREIQASGIKFNKSILLGTVPSDSASAQLYDTIENLSKERSQLLLSNGYDETILSPVYECNKCSDTGLVDSQEGDGDTPCICYRQMLIDHLYDQSNLSITGNEGFSCFNTDFYPDIINEKKYGIKKSPRRQITGILENCLHFAENFSNPEVKNLLFCGPTGVGKTFMANCLAIELMKSGRTVLYQTAPALFNAIYEYRYNSNSNEDCDPTLYKSILETELLIIDDLGTESPTAMRYAELLNIIDTRMSNNVRRPCKTIISTNIDLKNLFEYYDERIVSRITGGFDIFRFAGDDIRMVKAR